MKIIDKTKIPTEGEALTIEVVPGMEGGPPYIWIGDAEENFIDTIGPDDVVFLRDALTDAIRRWKR
jgi:hypothetical protein